MFLKILLIVHILFFIYMPFSLLAFIIDFKHDFYMSNNQNFSWIIKAGAYNLLTLILFVVLIGLSPFYISFKLIESMFKVIYYFIEILIKMYDYIR